MFDSPLRLCNYRVFSFELTLLTFSVSYMDYIIFQEYEEPVYSYSTYPGGDNPRVNPNISKCPLHSPVGEGVSASGGRLQSDSVQDTHLLPHS